MTATRRALLPLIVLVGISCRDGSSAFPSTALGRAGRDWLAAHNRAEGHAVVHFTMVNRGSARMTGAQMDSTVYAGVKLAQDLGPLRPVKVGQSSDTLLVVDLRTTKGEIWTAQFRPAVQPSLVKVAVSVGRTSVVQSGSSLIGRDSTPR